MPGRRRTKREVNRVFDSRKSQYLPECRHLRHVLVKVQEGATDDEKAAARAKIDDVAKRVKKEDFAAVAKAVSEDPGSAVRGGDLDCVTKGKMVKPFEDAAFALGEGQVSDVVETQFGYHLIKVDAILKGGDAEAEGRRETVRQLMMSEEAETLAAETAKKILAAAKGGKKLDDALSEALDQLLPKGAAAKNDDDRPKVEISGAFTAGGDPVAGASPGAHVGAIAFRLQNDGDLADDLVKLDDGYALIQLKEKTLATRDQFDKDRDTFIPAMISAKQGDALAGYVSRLRDAARSEIKLNDAYAKADEREKEKRPGEGDEE